MIFGLVIVIIRWARIAPVSDRIYGDEQTLYDAIRLKVGHLF